MNSPYRLAAALSFPLAIVLGLSALGGILLPAVYARENPFWAAQGIGQDWVDLLVVAPLTAMAAFFTLRRVPLFALVLAGTLAYTAYSLVLYAFFMHFGPLFLLYVCGLGLAFWALFAAMYALRSDDVREWFLPPAPVRLAGALCAALGALFYVLWLSEVVPALVSGTVLRSAETSGLITNPVHVLDLGIVLPAFVIGGVALILRRPLGYWLAPVMLVFAIVMDIALIGMAVSLKLHQTGAAGPPLAFLIGMMVATATVLALLLRRLAPPSGSAPTAPRPSR